jgi:hypothetical protein
MFCMKKSLGRHTKAASFDVSRSEFLNSTEMRDIDVKFSIDVRNDPKIGKQK